jgi:hypothetical protein
MLSDPIPNLYPIPKPMRNAAATSRAISVKRASGMSQGHSPSQAAFDALNRTIDNIANYSIFLTTSRVLVAKWLKNNCNQIIALFIYMVEI